MKRKGFTFIEFLVVIMIIALLAAILYPAFQQARNNGIGVGCVTNLKQLGRAVQMYEADFGSLPSSYSSNGTTWADALQVYVSGPATLDCPLLVGSEGKQPKYHFGSRRFSYGVNPQVCPSAESGLVVTAADIKQPASLILLADCRYYRLQPGYLAPQETEEGNLVSSSRWYNDPCNGEVMNPIHYEKANVLYFDGHVSHLRPDAVWRPIGGWNPCPEFGGLKSAWDPNPGTPGVP